MPGYTKSIENLIAEFSKLPGIGPRSAERIVHHLLRSSPANARSLAAAILEVKEKIRHCRVCNNLSERELCSICDDERRDRNLLCIVEESKDVTLLEKVASFKGVYHVLLGALSPLDNIGPEDLKIGQLIGRIKQNSFREVIIATNFDNEGELTALFLAKLLKPLKVKTTRIAYGIPLGSNLEYTDEVTLARALEGRREI